MTKLNPPETAPKDQMILVDVGLPWLRVGKFNYAENQWVYADPQMSFYMGNEDWWFENDCADEILGWLPIPEKGGE